jgi:hypothetical protein
MGRCGATELRGATAGTTSPAANRLAVRATAVTSMPVTVQATVPVPATVLVTVLVTVLAHGGRGAFRTMYRATGDRDEWPGGRLVASAAFLSATQRV